MITAVHHSCGFLSMRSCASRRILLIQKVAESRHCFTNSAGSSGYTSTLLATPTMFTQLMQPIISDIAFT